MNTLLYLEYKTLCDERNIAPQAEIKFNYVGGESDLLNLILAMRQYPPIRSIATRI